MIGYFDNLLKWYHITDDIDAIYAFAALNNVLLHLRLNCITFTFGHLITFNVKLYYIYGGVSYYIWGWFLSHLWLVLHLGLIFITFTVDITFRVVITFSGDTVLWFACFTVVCCRYSYISYLLTKFPPHFVTLLERK